MNSMRSYRTMAIRIFILMSGIILSLTSCNRQARHQRQLEQMARDAFYFGYPLVLMDRNVKFAAAVFQSQSKQKKVPMYQFIHVRNPKESRFKEILTLEDDMSYSMAWVNLSKDPVVLSVPGAGNKYYVGGLVGAWSEIFGTMGSRATGNKAQRFLIAGPQWRGPTPAGMTAIQAPTNLIWLPVQSYFRNEKERGESLTFQKGLKLTPLSLWTKNKQSSESLPTDPQLDLKKSPRDAVFEMSAEEYYRILCALMVDNPPSPMDEPMVSRMRNLGLVPTKSFKFVDLPSESQEALQASLKNAKSFLLSQRNAFTPTGRLVNGWTIPIEEGRAGVDYHRRAYEAYMHQISLPPQDAVFAVAYEDKMGQQLMGENSYKLTFPKGQLPPVNALWSLTMYQLPDVAFSGRRYQQRVINSKSRLKANADGSISIYLQPKSPGKNRESNWLPSKAGNYHVSLHLYWPKVDVLEGRWSPPVIERIEQERMAKF